jgi:hypothetical protein
MMMVSFGPAKLPDEPPSIETLLSHPMPPKLKAKIAMLSAVLAQAAMKKDDDQ